MCGSLLGAIEGDTRSLDYGSYRTEVYRHYERTSGT